MDRPNVINLSRGSTDSFFRGRPGLCCVRHQIHSLAQNLIHLHRTILHSPPSVLHQQDVPTQYMKERKYCGPTLPYSDRVTIAQNILNQATGIAGSNLNQVEPNIPGTYLERLAGWDEKPSKRMGIAQWWVSTEGTTARMAQCKANSEEVPPVNKKCGLKKCDVCYPPDRPSGGARQTGPSGGARVVEREIWICREVCEISLKI